MDRDRHRGGGLALGAAALTWVAPDAQRVEVGARGAGLPRHRSRHRRLASRCENVPGNGDAGEHLGHLVHALPRRDAGHAAVYDSLGTRGFRIAASASTRASPEDVVAASPQSCELTFDILHDRSGAHPAGLSDHRRARELPARPATASSSSGSSAPTTGARRSTAARRAPARPARRSSVAGWILGIETSCDETSAAVLRAEGGVGSARRATSSSRRTCTGSSAAWCPSWRAGPTCGRSARWWTARSPTRASASPQLDGVAVTAGPGLVGALLVGVMYGKTLAFSLDRPLLGREPSRGPSLRAVARGPRARAALRGAAGERRAHHAARRARLGRVPPAGPDAGRRRRRGVRQGGQAARARLSRRPGDRAARRRRAIRAASPSPGRCSRSWSATGPTATPSRSADSRPPCCARSRGAAHGRAAASERDRRRPRARLPGRGDRRAGRQDRARRRGAGLPAPR